MAICHKFGDRIGIIAGGIPKKKEGATYNLSWQISSNELYVSLLKYSAMK